MKAGCEIATKKSKVLSNSVFVRTKLQERLQPLGVQATGPERNLGIDFASGRRVATVVRRARMEKSKGRVRRIRKIHRKSSVPRRRRLAQIAHASVAKANHYALRGGSHRDQWNAAAPVPLADGVVFGKAHARQERNCGENDGAKRARPGLRLPDTLALTHAVWDRWMPLATVEKCVRKAQLEQRENAQPWAAVRGPLGADVATLARMQ